MLNQSESHTKESCLEARQKKIQQLKLGLKSKLNQTKAITKLSQETKPKLISESGNDDSTSEPRTHSEKKIQRKKHFEEKYQMGKMIGFGRNGRVYKCWHKQGKKDYAVKKVRFQLEHIIFLKENFYQVKKISHPYIIGYKSLYFETNKRNCYLVMELFPHKSLKHIKLNNPIKIRNIINHLLQVVKFLHSKGICHRDIKPQNILYDPESQIIKVIDFGVSKKYKIRHFQKQMMTCTGSQFYKAPQMISGGIYNEMIDEWAVGITLYEIVTGETPFESQYISEVNQKIKECQLVFDEKIWEDFKFAKDLVQKLLKPVKDRITASEALEHLWFQKQRIDKTSSIKIEVKRSFSIDEQEKKITTSQRIKDDPILQSIRLDNPVYIKQSLTNKLPMIGQQYWVHSQEEEDDENYEK